jgi:D-alanyl-D-alanine carboxypeptidase
LPGAVLVCLVAAALVAASAPAKPDPSTGGQPAGLEKDLDALVAAGAPGAILFTRNGTHTRVITAGLADVPHQRPIRPGDHFKVASVTKSYTASVVLQLAAEGKLGLGDSVERRLPKLVPNGKSITILQLLNHTSGLFDFENDRQLLKPYYAGELDHYWSMRQLLQRAVTHKPLFAPGTRHSYSNTNYVVAGLIIEAITGRSIGAELRSRIFRPLHLDQTTYLTTSRGAGGTRMPTPYVHGYTVFGKAGFDITGISPWFFPASGGIISTVGDVADFYRALLSGRLLQPDQLKAMKTMVPAQDAGANGYGLGLMRWSTACGPGWGHDGGLPGYWVRSFSTANGRRQAVLMINHDPETLAIPARALFQRLIARAYC